MPITIKTENIHKKYADRKRSLPSIQLISKSKPENFLDWLALMEPEKPRCCAFCQLS